MESLDKTDWDVIISGTGLSQSLLALALSRSGKRILHVDRNDYYGGDEAAFSLSEAESWARKHASASPDQAATFSRASVQSESEPADHGKLLSPRAYSIALAPQLLYARSSLLAALVSSRLHNQLEFQAVGSFLVDIRADGSSASDLIRVPGSREDVFQDKSLDLKAKRSLMKFLRSVASFEEQPETWQNDMASPLPAFLQSKFGLPPKFQTAISALTMSSRPPAETTVDYAIPRIARHLTSIGIFGPGFSAVLPKWGGLAEIGQVACRACAVGGGVYVLGRAISDVTKPDGDSLHVQLDDGADVTTTYLVGGREDLPPNSLDKNSDRAVMNVCRSISVVSSALTSLFPPTSEGGVTPAGAVVMVPPERDDLPPTHLLIHSSESGECPSGQCIIYASTLSGSEDAFDALSTAVDRLLHSVKGESSPTVLWKLQYQQRVQCPAGGATESESQTYLLPSLPLDLAFDDSVLESVKAVWSQVTGSSSDSFLQFDARETSTFDDDDDALQ